MTAVQLTETSPRDGCTGPGCGAQQTVQLHPYDGRRCADHATLPPGPYDRSLADEMCVLGRHDAAFAYLRAWIAREADRRFTAAAARVGAGR